MQAPLLTSRFGDAFRLALELHARQLRKGTRIPYVAHLLSVAALVLEHGGDEDQAIAGLLHDAVEDQGGRPTLERIRGLFGDRVATIVEGCSDADAIPKAPWLERKQRYLAHLVAAPAEVLLVSSADKLHNARAILVDLRREGASVFGRFNGGRAGTIWYYRALTEACRAAGVGFLAEELERVVGEIERLAPG